MRLRSTSVRAVIVAMAASTSSVLPIGLVGVFVLQIRSDLGIELGAYGVIVAGFFASTSFAGLLVGEFVDRIGARRAIQLGAVISSFSMIGLATSTGPWSLAFWLLVAGVGQALAHPSANRLLSRVVKRRLGLAFGLKQSAIPSATMLASIALPTLGLILGWRGTFVAMGGMTMLIVVAAQTLRRPPGSSTEPASSRSERAAIRRRLASLAIGGSLGAAAASPLATFLVDSGVNTGLTEPQAASVLGSASIAGVASRIGFGWVADRVPTINIHLLVAGLMGAGAAAYLMLAFASVPLYVLGAVIGYTLGWSWNGLVHYMVVKEYAQAPAVATSTVQPGLAFGAGVGPLVFGLLAGTISFTAAWIAMAVMAALGGALVYSRGLRQA